MIQQTSLMAWNDIQPSLSQRQQDVYDLFKKYGQLYDQKIAFLLNLPINCVTPRRNELQNKKNLIKKEGIIISEYSNKPVNIYNIINK